ncbi:adhesion G-protein coupled receptor G6-like [Musca autumnalis]|uniref:adhesion G-protein coupled receptor G6-like n=1 Tax=Musca autumnalis TaxID=221902 RepID=UPI003CF81598
MKFLELTIILYCIFGEIRGKVPKKLPILYCRAMSFEHNYLQENGLLQRKIYIWPPAAVGKLVRPSELCLLSAGIPLVRKCNYNSNSSTAEWEDINFNNITCLGYSNDSHLITFELQKLYKEITKFGSKQEFLQTAKKFYKIISKPNYVLTVADLEISLDLVQFITKSRDANVLPQLLKIANVLLQSTFETIAKFNELSGATTLVETFENYFNSMANLVLPRRQCKGKSAYTIRFDAENIKVFYVNPTCSKISGIAVFQKSQHKLSHQMLTTDYEFQYINLNQSLNGILSQFNIEGLAYVPEYLWNHAKRNNCRLKFSWYRNSNLFRNVTDYSKVKDGGSALLVALSGCTGMQPKYIPFRREDSTSNETMQCFYWQEGEWKKSTKILANSTDILLCENITTNQQQQLTSSFDRSRLIRSIIACILSLFGLFCIFLTALFYENWRRQFSNKLLLNICAILLLITSYVMLLNVPSIRAAIENAEHPSRCIAVGAFFQYSLLVVFLWMLFIAMLQYQRYKCVFDAKVSRNYIGSYALAAWCLPLIPTILVVCLDSQSYTRYLNKSEQHFLCHPSGLSWILGLLLPTSGIILTCIVIFAYILWNIRRASKKFHLTLERDDVILHVRRSVILIVVLSISWIFGLLGNMGKFGFFKALFCFTSTMQGFFLFLYFVVMDKYARHFWQQRLCSRHEIIVVE